MTTLSLSLLVRGPARCTSARKRHNSLQTKNSSGNKEGENQLDYSLDSLDDQTEDNTEEKSYEKLQQQNELWNSEGM